MSVEMADWLLEQIADDEKAAQAAQGEPVYSLTDTAAEEVLEMAANEGCAPAGVEHFVRHVPDRVLAECEAKRATVATYRRWLDDAEMWRERARYGGTYHLESAHRCDDYAGLLERAVLRPMTVPYADRPGFKEQWRG